MISDLEIVSDPYSQRGFCTAKCTKYCDDKPGSPVSYCVADPADDSQGICVLKETALNHECRPLDHFVPATRARFNQPSKTEVVCVPGSPGWIGDHCFDDDDCSEDNHCAGATGQSPGTRTQSCSKYCPDEPGWPTTFCVDEPDLGGPSCLRTCDPESNAAECPAGTVCTARARRNGSTIKHVCQPE